MEQESTPLKRGPKPGNGDHRESDLASLLRGIEQAERVEEYPLRNTQVYQAAGLASSLGYPVGVRLDPDEPLWPVLFIELPTGQVSWHLPAFSQGWDGHDTPTKYARCRAYAEGR